MSDFNPYKTGTHRKTWIAHNGPIPKESNGRSYEIHHIDGNPENNDISNLVAVTLQEHYNIHYAQGDFNACVRIGQKLKLSPGEIAENSRQAALKRLANGTHNWQDSVAQAEKGRKSSAKQLANGTHPFLNTEYLIKKHQERITNGTHQLMKRPDGTSQASDRVASGNHIFVGENSPSQVLWVCPHCNKQGKGKGNYTKYHGDNCTLVNPDALKKRSKGTRAVVWQITKPDSTVIIVKNLNAWAKDNNVSKDWLYANRHGYKAIKL